MICRCAVAFFTLVGALGTLLLSSPSGAQVIKTAPPAGTFQLRADLKGVHPRLHFVAADIPALRAKGKGGGAFFVKRMKAAFGSYKGKSVDVAPSHWKTYLYGLWGQLAMNLLWIVEEDVAYADTAKSWALYYAKRSDWCPDAKKTDDLIPHEVMTGLALTYDIQYDRLTPAERKTIRDKLKQLIDWQYQRFFVGQYWTQDFQNNHMHNRIAGMAHAAIAILGDDPSVDVQKHADLAFHAHELLADWMPKDGSTHEGPGYWDYGFHWLSRGEALFAHATGKATTASEHHQNYPYYRLYMLTPGLLNTYRIGDSGGDGPASNLEAMLPSIARHKSERLHAFLDEQMTKNEGGFYQQAAWGLLWYDPSVGKKPYDTLPLSRVFNDIDVVSARSAWDNKGVGMVFSCGPPGGHLMQQKKEAGATTYINVAHDHPDQNSFVLFAHDQMLAMDDGYPKDKKLTAAHNTLLIDGEGGPKEGTGWYQPFPYDETAFLRDVAHSGATAVASGDASRLYLKGKRFVRHVAFVEGQYLLLIDDVAGEGAGDHDFDWRLHGDGSWKKVAGDHFRMTKGTDGAALSVYFAAPAAAQLQSSFFAAAGKAAPGLSVQTKASETQFLTAVVPEKSGAPTVSVEQRSATGGWAIRATLGDITDLWLAAEAKTPGGAAAPGQVKVDDVDATATTALLRRDKGALALALLTRGTALSVGGSTVIASDIPANLVWRPMTGGGALELAVPYRGDATSATVTVGGLEPSASYCLTIDGGAAGGVAADAQGAVTLASLQLPANQSGNAARQATLTKGTSCPGGSGSGDGGPSPSSDGSIANDGSAGGDGDGGGPGNRANEGCGCGVSAAGEASALWLLLALVAWRRRRRAGVRR
jgi:hypothetical protein